MSLEITGKLAVKYDTMVVSEKFKKREFIVEIAEEINGNTYTNYGKFQLVQNKCDIIDRAKIGDTVKVFFNIKGNRFEKNGKYNYMTNLDAWRVEVLSQAQNQQANSAPPAQNYNSGSNDDSLPF